MIQTRKCTHKKESERCETFGLLNVPKSIASETTMKMMHKEVGLREDIFIAEECVFKEK
jgi:hypothetical protein